MNFCSLTSVVVFEHDSYVVLVLQGVTARGTEALSSRTSQQAISGVLARLLWGGLAARRKGIYKCKIAGESRCVSVLITCHR